MHLLLIDDNELDLRIAQRLLEVTGVAKDAYLFTTAQEALDFLRQHQHAEKIQILLDIQMPEMNGFDFLKVLRQELPQLCDRISVAVLSSSIHHMDLAKAESHPLVTAVLPKPLEPEKVRAWLAG